MRIVWRRRALRDLDALFDYVVAHHRGAALRLMGLIRRRVGQLADHPELGRQGRVPGTRELVVGGTKYIVAYRVGDTEISILAIIHTARRWPGGFD
jgi:addiction module RelE/StbE family toxin